MKRPRPSIPLSVRVAVAERMLGRTAFFEFQYSRDKLQWLLFQLFGDQKVHLDHDPALILREFCEKTGQYTPAANDPNHLIYRTVREHLEKTIGRKSDAEKTVTTKGSDIYLKAKFKRLESAPKPKQKIFSRGFPKTSRPFPKKRKSDVH